MMKKILATLLFCLPFILAGQVTDSTSTSRTRFSFSGNTGYLTTGAETYSQIRLLPELTFGKFGIGLDIDLLINSRVNIRNADWDGPEDILSKIYYLRYAERGNPLYVKAGGFSGYTLGHGLIMNDYTNRLLYPDQKNFGAAVGFNLNLPLRPSGEIFSADLFKNQILAAQAAIKPFTKETSPLLAELTIGATGVWDRNQYGKYDDKDGDQIPDVIDPNPGLKNYRNDLDGDHLLNSETPDASGQYQTDDPDMDGDGILDSPELNSYVEANLEVLDPDLNQFLDNEIRTLKRYGKADDVTIGGINCTLPLVYSPAFRLDTYAEAAQISGFGKGFIFPALAAGFSVFKINLELRNFSDRFIPGYFDYLYDEQRSGILGDSLLTTKNQLLQEARASYGWYGKVEAEIGKVVIAGFSYQDMHDGYLPTGKSVTAKISLDPQLLPQLKEAYISYSQANVPYLSAARMQTPSAMINGVASCKLSSRSVLTGRYAERYVDLDGNNQIKGSNEIIKSLSLIIEYRF